MSCWLQSCWKQPPFGPLNCVQSKEKESQLRPKKRGQRKQECTQKECIQQKRQCVFLFRVPAHWLTKFVQLFWRQALKAFKHWNFQNNRMSTIKCPEFITLCKKPSRKAMKERSSIEEDSKSTRNKDQEHREARFYNSTFRVVPDLVAFSFASERRGQRSTSRNGHRFKVKAQVHRDASADPYHPLLALPNELLLKILDFCTLADLRSFEPASQRCFLLANLSRASRLWLLLVNCLN